MRVNTITMDRGDRPQFLPQCKYYLERMGADKIMVTYPPENDKIDIVPRVRLGLEIAKMQGAEFAFFIESDDWYSSDYLKIMQSEVMLNNCDIIGISGTMYYNVVTRRYETMSHSGHSSLFCTGVRVSKAIPVLNELKDDTKFVDIELFKKIRNKHMLPLKMHNRYIAVGIKHEEGKRAGIGHTKNLPQRDKDGELLKAITGYDYGFYADFAK
jgi:hypothetical protein